MKVNDPVPMILLVFEVAVVPLWKTQALIDILECRRISRS
jgi:hypothetical protein